MVNNLDDKMARSVWLSFVGGPMCFDCDEHYYSITINSRQQQQQQQETMARKDEIHDLCSINDVE